MADAQQSDYAAQYAYRVVSRADDDALHAERDRLREALTLIRGEAMFASNTRDALRRVETIATAALEPKRRPGE